MHSSVCHRHARFDDDFLINRCKKVVDNYKLYEAWAEEFPYPSYEMVQIIGSKFTDYLHEGRIQREDIVDIADIINKKHPGRESDDEDHCILGRRYAC